MFLVETQLVPGGCGLFVITLLEQNNIQNDKDICWFICFFLFYYGVFSIIFNLN